MIKTIQVCDRCGKETSYESVYAVVGEQRLPTGESEDKAEAVDLCPLCMRAAMQDLVGAMGFVDAADFVAKYRKKLVPIRM